MQGEAAPRGKCLSPMDAHTALDPKPSPREPNPPEIQHTAALGALEQGYSREILGE